MSTASSTTGGPLQCMVVTPERTVLDERAEFVAVPLYDGELGIMRGRAPLIGRLGQGLLRTRSTDGRTHEIFVDGGFVQVRDDVVTLLTSRATSAENVDAAVVQKDLAAARAIVAKTPEEQAEKDRAIARGRALTRLSSK
jgi:F-type H+-transporting ATPase subunit epsilon